MSLTIKEADWKVLRGLYDVALERFCERVLEEVRSTLNSSSKSAHDRYLNIFDLMRRRDKELAGTFDDLRRSTALILLANIKHEGLLTSEELMRFSEETREALKPIDMS